jgi:hypothetical protein
MKDPMKREFQRMPLRRRAALFLCLAGFCAAAKAEQFSENIVSEHVRLRLPVEREWIGRDVIPDLERCWQFIERAIAGKLPRRVLVLADWNKPDGDTQLRDGDILIGMNDVAAAANAKEYLLHRAAREMARAALLVLSQDGADREDARFLLQGMAEIYAHEFRGSARGLGSAWTLTHFLDRVVPLELQRLTSWAGFAQGRSELCAAAPGITFLLACRQQYGRESLLKLFEAMRKDKAMDALSRTFRTSAANLQAAWLKKARSYNATQNVTVTTDADAPVLKEAAPAAGPGRAAGAMRLRIVVEDASANVHPCGLFVTDLATGKVVQARSDGGADGRNFLVEWAIPGDTAPGKHAIRITAVDDAGNVRSWNGEYLVER